MEKLANPFAKQKMSMEREQLCKVIEILDFIGSHSTS
jgi:hypothetical protein